MSPIKQSHSGDGGQHLLYVTKTSIVGNGGGGEKRAREVVSRFADKGYDVTVVCGRTDADLSRWETYEGCQIRHVTCAPEAILGWDRLGFYLPRYLFAFTSLPIIALLLVRETVDVVVENMTPYPTLTGVLAQLFGVPIDAVQHEFHGRDCLQLYGPLTGGIQLVVQNLLRVVRYDAIVVPAAHTKKKLEEYGVAADRIEVVPNGIAASEYRKPSVESKAGRLVTVGRLCKRKGQDDLLRAFARLHSGMPKTHLDVVGDGPCRDEFETLAEKLGIAEAVTFHGYVSHVEKIRLLNRAKLFVFASRQEGFGLALLEAMAAGLPVVARRLPVYEGLVPETEANQLFDDPFAQSFVGASRPLLKDNERRVRVSEMNRERAIQYDWDHTAAEMQAIVEGVRPRPDRHTQPPEVRHE